MSMCGRKFALDGTHTFGVPDDPERQTVPHADTNREGSLGSEPLQEAGCPVAGQAQHVSDSPVQIYTPDPPAEERRIRLAAIATRINARGPGSADAGQRSPGVDGPVTDGEPKAEPATVADPV